MRNSSDTIGNRTCDLPDCSTVPQPLRHRVPPDDNVLSFNFFLLVYYIVLSDRVFLRYATLTYECVPRTETTEICIRIGPWMLCKLCYGPFYFEKRGIKCKYVSWRGFIYKSLIPKLQITVLTIT
jgi:hypothetical protein